MQEKYNVVCVYDGSFDGFLTSVFNCWQEKNLVEICSEKRYQPKLTDSVKFTETDETKAQRVKKWLSSMFGTHILLKVYRVFLTEENDAEIHIFKYLKYLHKKGKKAIRDIVQPQVNYIEKMERSFNGETHKMYGFLRFKELSGGVLFSEIKTKYNQLEPLMKFFHERQPGSRIVIYDSGRNAAAVCDGQNRYITSDFNFKPPGETDFSGKYESMWCEYLDVLSIKERENRRLQCQMMPLKYRPFMTEFNSKDIFGNKKADSLKI